jgi:hypothetical protein
MIVTDSHVLVGSGDAIYAVNLATHFSEWSYPVSGSLALSEGVLYVAGSDGTLTAITAPSSYSATNQPPVCIIGGPYRALCNNTTATVQLDGSDSYDANDPQGGILTYSWSTDCPGGSFDDPTSPTPILTLSCSITQAFTVTLVVSDGQQTSSNQTAVTVNHAPVCIIGGPYQAECNGSATTVQLDGSGSYDPDGGVLNYKWSTACPGGSFDDPTSPTPILTMDCTATQACWVVLVVSNGQQTSFSLASVTVGDTLPPSLSRLAAKPATLWPPSHQLVPVAIQGAAIDACDPAPTFKIISISSSDAPMSKPPLTFPVGPSFPERPPAPMLPNSSSISDYKITGAHTLMLRADCANPRVGRTYTITVQGKDEAGNTSTRKLVVKVPAATK